MKEWQKKVYKIYANKNQDIMRLKFDPHSHYTHCYVEIGLYSSTNWFKSFISIKEFLNASVD